MEVNAFHHLSLEFGEVHPVWLEELAGEDHPGHTLAEDSTVQPLGLVLTVTVLADDGRAVTDAEGLVRPSVPDRAILRAPTPRPGQTGSLEIWVTAALLRYLIRDFPYVSEVETVATPANHQLLRELGFRTRRVHLVVEAPETGDL
ncbi:hypothetical protein [Longispora albida]|uniref:hypothetical protein n=1 Tax=Longispora albida TaxID=203523 RepID=UPI000375BCC2|nr:hypothetical protein [Longispora albida]